MECALYIPPAQWDPYLPPDVRPVRCAAELTGCRWDLLALTPEGCRCLSHAFQSFRAGFMRAESTAPAGRRKCGTPGDSAAAAAGGSGNPAAAFGDAAVADAADSHVCTVVSSHQKGGALWHGMSG